MKMKNVIGVLVLLVCFVECAPVTNYESEDRRLGNRRRRPCGGRSLGGKTFGLAGNTLVLGDITVVSCGNGLQPGGGNKPGLFHNPGPALFPGIKPGGGYQGVKPGQGGFNPQRPQKPGGGLLSNIFGSGGWFNNPGGFPGFPPGGINGGPGLFENIFGILRPPVPPIGGVGGGAHIPADVVPDVEEGDPTEPEKPVFEEIPEDPVTELYKPLPIVGVTSHKVTGHRQDLSHFIPGRRPPPGVITQLGKQFNTYLINPFVDLFT